MKKPDPGQLPHIVKLIDDESPIVRGEAALALASFGDELERELRNLYPALDESFVEQALKVSGINRKPSDIETLLRESGEEVESNRLFIPGQLVKHKKYGYRGVIVDYDLFCQADETWFKSNSLHPNMHQPWYHVLVHLTDKTTYAAQSSLAPDTTGQSIIHPLLMRFFISFEDGYYIRNSRSWPKHSL